MPEPIETPSTPPLGPYSVAVRAGDWIVCAGQIGVDPATGELAGPALGDQVRQALANTEAVLSQCGCGWEHVAKVTLFVAVESPKLMPEVNAIYGNFGNPPLQPPPTWSRPAIPPLASGGGDRRILVQRHLP